MRPKTPIEKRVADLPARFWSKVDKSGGAGTCWPWKAARDHNGYGKIGHLGRTLIAPRVAWLLTNGDGHAGFMLCHRCDNPACCNPSHLFLGTAKDNNADMIAKGRDRRPLLRGERNPKAKLTADQVREIRLRKRSGEKTKPLASAFGVSTSLVRQIMQGRVWSGDAH